MANRTNPLAKYRAHASRGTVAEIHLTVRLVDVPSDFPEADIPTGSRGLGPLPRMLAARMIGRALTRDDIVSARLIGETILELCVLDRATHCAHNQGRMRNGRAVHLHFRRMFGISPWRYRTDPDSRARVRALARRAIATGECRGFLPHVGHIIYLR